MHPGPDTPYDTRRPPGLRRRRALARWSRPEGTLTERLGRARLVHLLGRAGSVGDWIALSLGAIGVAAVLAAGSQPSAEGRIRAPHMGLDYALSEVETGPTGTPALARIHAAGPGLARTLAPGDLLAVETGTDAGWYRVEQVELVACAAEAPAGKDLYMTTACREGQDRRAVIRARPVRPGNTGWI